LKVLRGYLGNLVSRGDSQVVSIARAKVKEWKRQSEDVIDKDGPEKRGENSALWATKVDSVSLGGAVPVRDG
jgi:hypothetical protein